MDKKPQFKRDRDGLFFYVEFLSHWSDIVSMDGKDRASVKWYGGDDLYISHDGEKFTKLKD